ncbi:Sensor kinase CusS [compost metagenome]
MALMILLLTTVSITWILAYYYASERQTFFDDQIRQTATAIIDSRLSDLKTYDYELADSIISEELGPDRIGKFFIIRNSKNEILFQTDNIDLLETQIPRSPRWITINEDKRLIRVANLDLPRFGGRTLQVGIITDSSFVFWSTLNSRTLFLIGVLLVVVLVMTWVLSASLFSPVKSVAMYVNDATRALEKNKDIPELTRDLKKYLFGRFVRKEDEFKRLLNGISSLAQQVNLNSKFTKSWTFQMVHELKTPLTILNRDLEVLGERYPVTADERQALAGNLEKVSGTITNFLDWAELANTATSRNLHVVRMSGIMEDLAEGWRKLDDGRLQLKQLADFQVMCDPFHLQQLLSNLVVNALKYSQEAVEVEVGDHRVVVRDHGFGLPREVMERFGSPFNKGPKNPSALPGSGLGLAWVKSITERYSWQLMVNSDENGSEFIISFPPLKADD